MLIWLLIIASIFLCVVVPVVGYLIIYWARPTGPAVIASARIAFANDRSPLEQQFFEAASNSGKPRGLTWKSCDFGQDLELAFDKKNRELVGLVTVTIAFEAIPGSDMEGLPAVSNLRSASAVFSWQRGRWTTGGRTVFNLSPLEAIRYFGDQYERIEQNDATAK
jgi:hypothetical protein